MALFCDATLLVARHGDADYPHEGGILSDHGGWLTPTGREQVTALVERVRDRRIARVFTSELDRARESAELAASLLDVPVVALRGLEEYSVGTLAGRAWEDRPLQPIQDAWSAGDLARRIPGGESGADIIERYTGALQAIADQHRGETTLVISHGGVMSFVLPRVSGNVRDDLADKRFLANCAAAELLVGDDGWRVVHWPGVADDDAV
ncbi:MULTISPECIES: histidine phosphatase family protein [unclassified Janibacter]|uniref:histidine phosphatase family protein n=1 Tax=unclassified Janibacter TaxID=2649294 RepID=UPI003D04BD5C